MTLKKMTIRCFKSSKWRYKRMVQKQRLLIYPYHNDFVAPVKHAEFFQDYEITSLVSPNGWGLVGKDAGSAAKQENIGIMVEGNFKEALCDCDAVLFITSPSKLDIETIIYPNMLEAIKQGKDILCEIKLEDTKKQELSKAALAHGVRCEFLTNPTKWLNPFNNEIYSFNTSVIFVLGMSEKTNKFDIQLALRERLLKEGYKVSQVGTKDYCELLGFHSMPDFMYGNNFSEHEKITVFNHYLKKIEKDEEPDVIVIGIPGGTMKFNNKFTSYYGVTAYEISQAVIPDAVICGVLYEEYKPAFFEYTRTSLKYKLGFDVDYYHLASYQFDWIRTDASAQMSYTMLDSKKVNQKIKELSESKTPVFNILEEQQADEMFHLILNQLSSYAQVADF
jgi:peptide maturation system protein (TIGR04066 family)